MSQKVAPTLPTISGRILQAQPLI